MLAQQYHDYCSALEKQGIIFSYSGYVSESLLEGLGQTITRKMQMDETSTGTANRVFGVFVEQVQNVIRYSAERQVDKHDPTFELSSGVVTIGRDGERFFVICGNLVLHHDVARLRSRLEQLCAMDKTALKALYKEKLREDAEPTSKGATIGLIEIARKASEPLQFDFMPVDEQHTFFCLKAYV